MITFYVKGITIYVSGEEEILRMYTLCLCGLKYWENNFQIVSLKYI